MLSKSEKPSNARKISTRIVKVAENENIEGTYKATVDRDLFNKDTGEVEIKQMVVMTSIGDDADRFAIWQDSGLKTAMSLSEMQVGKRYRLEKLKKMDIGQKRSVNQWDIYELE